MSDKTAADIITEIGATVDYCQRHGMSPSEIRHMVYSRYGLRSGYTAHDRSNSRAAKRRLRQMDKGMLPKVCECGASVPHDEPGRACWSCLVKKWS